MAEKKAAQRELVTACADPECAYCRLGKQLTDVLNGSDATAAVEILTLERVLATVIVDTTPAGADRAHVLAGVIEELRDDIQRIEAWQAERNN